MTEARNIVRELQALGAHLKRHGDRLVLRAGNRQIPQPLVQQARDAKRDILALLDSVDTLRPTSGNAVLLTSQKSVAVLAKSRPQSRRNADDLLSPPVGGLSGGLSVGFDALAPLDDCATASDASTRPPKREDPCGSCQDADKINHPVSGCVSVEAPKTATPTEPLAVLANREARRGFQAGPSTKPATLSCRESLSDAAPQQNSLTIESCETSGCLFGATEGLEKPCADRCGLVERQGGVFRHFCAECGRWGAFRYGAVGERLGKWYCFEHRSAGEEQ